MTGRLFRPRPVVALGLFVLAGSVILIQWLRFRTSAKDEKPLDLSSDLRVSDNWKRTESNRLPTEMNERRSQNRVYSATQFGRSPDDRELVVVDPTRRKRTEKPQLFVKSELDRKEQKLPGTRDHRTVLSGYISVLDDEPLRMNCKSCALVSSSGRVLRQKKGAEIDEADCVFRMNSAPTKGFETDVGSKTTVRILSQFSVPSGLKQAVHGDSALKFFIGWGSDKHLGKTTSKYNNMVEIAKRYPTIGIYRSSDKHYWYQDEIFEKETGQKRMESGSWLSTGWFTFDVMKQACPTTRIYGMIPEDYCRNPKAVPAPYHYWQSLGRNECSYYAQMENNRRGAHRFMSEKTIFARWAVRHNMTFHSPQWNPNDYVRKDIKFPTP